MTRDEFIGKLQMIYVGDKNASGDIIAEYDRLNKRNKELEDGFKAVNEELCEYAEIVDEFEKYLEEHSKINYECKETIIHEQLALSIALDYLKQLKEGK